MLSKVHPIALHGRVSGRWLSTWALTSDETTLLASSESNKGLVEGATFSVPRELITNYGPTDVERMVRMAVSEHPNLGNCWSVKPVEKGGRRNFDLLPKNLKVAESKDGAALKKALGELEACPPRSPAGAMKLRLVKAHEVHHWRACAMGVPATASAVFGSSTCSPVHSTPDDKMWALNVLRVPEVWDMRCEGQGVRIGHPDTGYVPHSELDSERIRDDLDYDWWPLIDDTDANTMHDKDWEDGMHGTGTASVIMSGKGGAMSGVAPRAELLPLRVTAPSVAMPGPALIRFGVIRLRKAINYAVDNGCDVISISLGAVFDYHGTGLEKALNRAHRNGVIVVAAAGNYTLNKDVYPAAYPTVISCAATERDASGKKQVPWGPSGWGNHVNVAAPGAGVWKAVLNSSHQELVCQGAGTSFATAHVAGIAALWLSHHGGRANIASKLGGLEHVASAFRKALRASAERSDSITSAYGAGLVDAFDTINQPL